jgi:hypothetical protein
MSRCTRRSSRRECRETVLRIAVHRVSLNPSRSFDIVLIDSDRLDIQMEALMRLRTWLGIMEGVRVRSVDRP